MRVATFLAVLFLMSSGSVLASDTDWTWYLYGNTAAFGTAIGASDAKDSQDVAITSIKPVYVATYHDSWNGDSDYYESDIREPLSQMPGASKTWILYLWGDPSLRSTATHIGLSWCWNNPNAPAFDKIEYRLTYVRSANGITGEIVPVGASVLLNGYQQGSWSFPTYRTTDGRTGYVFELTATVVPEPSSFVALAAGLLPLGIIARRRRR